MAEISFKDRMTTQLLLAATQDDGMSTAEYAIGTMVPIHRAILGRTGQIRQSRVTPAPPHTYPAWTQPARESPRSPSRCTPRLIRAP